MRQGELFDLGAKEYQCRVCEEWLTAAFFHLNASNPGRDGLQRECKECRSKRGQKSVTHCDLCNEKAAVLYTLEDRTKCGKHVMKITYHFCSAKCYRMWVYPERFYQMGEG